MKYGIELEFFVRKDNIVIPAYLATSNLDGNPVVGEIKTLIHDNIVDCVFELKKILFNERQKLKETGHELLLISSVKVDETFLRNLRKDQKYINNKELEVLEELSVYPKGKEGKILPRGVYKASLQINFSNNRNFSYPEYEKITVEDKYKFISTQKSKSYSGIFDFSTIIQKLDIAFAQDIKETGRVKGVYAIKNGELGDRIEYRSLPNNIDLMKLIETLK